MRLVELIDNNYVQAFMLSSWFLLFYAFVENFLYELRLFYMFVAFFLITFTLGFVIDNPGYRVGSLLGSYYKYVVFAKNIYRDKFMK